MNCSMGELLRVGAYTHDVNNIGQRLSQDLKKGGVYFLKVSVVISEDKRFIIFAYLHSYSIKFTVFKYSGVRLLASRVLHEKTC